MARPHTFTRNLAVTHSQGTASHGEHIHQSPPPVSCSHYQCGSVCKLFIPSVRGSACHCVWLFVLQRLNGVTSLSGRSVRCSQCPMLSAIVSAPSGCSPSRTQALLRLGYWAGVALILKETPFFLFFLSFPHLHSLTVIFFSPSLGLERWMGSGFSSVSRESAICAPRAVSGVRTEICTLCAVNEEEKSCLKTKAVAELAAGAATAATGSAGMNLKEKWVFSSHTFFFCLCLCMLIGAIYARPRA